MVLRPNDPGSPARLGGDPVRRVAPYLLVEVRIPPRGQDCSAARTHDFFMRLDLNDFGLPSNLEVELTSIRPRWVSVGDRQHFAYEVGLKQYGADAPQYVAYVAPWVPVLGLLQRVSSHPSGETQLTIFRESAACDWR